MAGGIGPPADCQNPVALAVIGSGRHTKASTGFVGKNANGIRLTIPGSRRLQDSIPAMGDKSRTISPYAGYFPILQPVFVPLLGVDTHGGKVFSEIRIQR